MAIIDGQMNTKKSYLQRLVEEHLVFVYYYKENLL